MLVNFIGERVIYKNKRRGKELGLVWTYIRKKGNPRLLYLGGTS